MERVNPEISLAAARLDEAAQLLRPATLDQCLHALAQVIEILDEMAVGNPRDWDPEARTALHRIRGAAGNLQRQIEHGSNLVRGWMQIRFSAGYTRGGQPEFDGRESRGLFEV